MTKYDCIIIGAGPAGIFAALELSKKDDMKVLIIDKGKELSNRDCAITNKKGKCYKCNPCNLVSGWGGAGAFSDGKLTLTKDFGGFLTDYQPEEKIEELIDEADKIYQSFGAPTKHYEGDKDKIKQFQREAVSADLKLIPAKIRHLGTDSSTQILADIREHLDQYIDVLTGVYVKDLLVDEGKVIGVETKEEEKYYSDFVISAPGRSGSEWFLNQIDKLGLQRSNNPVDIGVRVEVPAVTLEHITNEIYESKLLYHSHSFEDSVRTFCMNPHGEVVLENNEGLMTVNGHSYANYKTENTNFALLVSKNFTKPFNEPIRYGKDIARLANMLGGGVLVQRLGDLLNGRRTTEERLNKGHVKPTLNEATPGDLSLVLPYRHLVSIRQMLKAMDEFIPGIYSRHTLLYGVEVKFYSSRRALDNNLETSIKNLFACGDGAGVTRGLIQASVSGMLVAREILKRY